MAAFIWNTNPRMWSVAPPFADSFDVLKAYVCDPSAYVYWSTPRRRTRFVSMLIHNSVKLGP